MLGYVFVMGCFYVTLSTLFSLCFVMDCQKGSLLGSVRVHFLGYSGPRIPGPNKKRDLVDRALTHRS